MTRLIGISGSLRKQSYNSALLRAAATMMPDGTELILGTIKDIPLYDGDIQRVFGGKPVAVMGASPGGFGTILSQNAWLPVWRTLGAQAWFGGRLMVSRAQKVFDDHGALRPVALRIRRMPPQDFPCHVYSIELFATRRNLAGLEL